MDYLCGIHSFRDTYGPGPYPPGCNAIRHHFLSVVLSFSSLFLLLAALGSSSFHSSLFYPELPESLLGPLQGR